MFKHAFGEISGGKVLDVATGRGNFVEVLRENLKDYAEITGIDSNERALETARAAFNPSCISFQCMDADRLDFADESFDTVAIANSLHHLAHLPQALSEMLRVLKPGGHWLLCEMYCDGQTEAQMTHVRLHHWWARIDSASNVTHRPTYTRQQLIDIVAALNFTPVAYYDFADTSYDPCDAELVAELDRIIDQYLQRADGLPDGDALKHEGELLRQRVHTIGFHSATALIAVGRK